MRDGLRLVYLLAGGESLRFGSNKARVEVDGQPLLLSHLRSLERQGLQAIIVAQNEEDYADWSVRTIADSVKRAGPLAGLMTALEDCRNRDERWCVIGTCDLFRWRAEWLSPWRSVIHLAQSMGGVGPKIAVFSDDLFRPFPGVYSVEILEIANDLMQSEKRSMRSLFDRLADKVHRIEIDSSLLPESFNTKQEFETLEKMHCCVERESNETV